MIDSAEIFQKELGTLFCTNYKFFNILPMRIILVSTKTRLMNNSFDKDTFLSETIYTHELNTNTFL